jgi:tetratricopeptide (TPR) repeat protein
LLYKASLVVAVESFRQHLPRVLEQLEQDSGLALYAGLSALPAEERLSQALAQQQQRYLAIPEHERVHGMTDAVRELSRLTAATCSMATSMIDMELIETLPSLEPLFPRFPQLRVVAQLAQAGKDWIAGHALRSAQRYEQVLARLAEPDRAGMDPTQYQRIWLGVHYALALIEASLGIERAEERAKILEGDRGLRVAAWRVRMLLHLNQGSAEAARKCARRAELLQLQDGFESYYLGTTAGFELRACGLAEDLLGVKRALDAIGPLVEKHRGWRPNEILGQSRYRELQGDLPGALELLLPGFELAPPGRHLLFGFMAAAHVRILRGLDDTQAALSHAQHYTAICERDDLTASDHTLRMELALTLACAGQHEAALNTIDRLIQWSESIGSTGLALGMFYEARARIAIAMGDRASFESFSAQCAREYKKGRNSALSAKFARLLEDGRRRGLAESDPVRETTVMLEADPETEYNTVSNRIIECVDGPDRARCALTMLLQSTDTYQGYLYGVEDSELTPLAGLPELRAEESLERWLQQWVRAEHELASQTPVTLGTVTASEPPPLLGESDSETQGTCSLDGEARNEVPSYCDDAEGRRFKAVLLVGQLEGGRRIAAVLALEVTSRQSGGPSQQLLSQIADQLLENGDVDGMPVAS